MAEERVQRRLAAIMAADVVGYSRLVEADETGTLAAFKGHLDDLIAPAIADNRGRLVKTIGDGVLAEFRSAVDAVLCARAIQDGMATRNADVAEDRQFTFRIGINVGDIVIDGDDIHGDGVNVASRLEGICKPGGICISSTVHDHVLGKLDLGFRDLGAQEVKNLSRPIHAFEIVGIKVTTAPAHPKSRWRIPAIAATVAIIVVTAGGLAWWLPRAPDVETASIDKMAHPLPDKPSMAVLPFANLSGDKEQEYFSDGITEDIITDLSKISGLFVIARTSTNRYKGKKLDVRQIAQELGVRYVVEGSVRKSAGRVRVTAQLIDATTGSHVWAERYDRELTDVFAVQDDVSAKVVSRLAVTLTAEERQRTGRKHVPKPEAHDLVLRGTHVYIPPTSGNLARARRLLERAIEVDPRYSEAYSRLATVLALAVFSGTSKSRAEDSETAIRMARKAISLDGSSGRPYVALARLHLSQGRFDEAVREMETAVRIDPGNAAVQWSYGYFLAVAGRAEESIAPTERALRLAPLSLPAHSTAAATYFFAGRYADAIKHFKRRESLGGSRANAPRESLRAAAEILAGMEEAARITVRNILQGRPGYTLAAAMRSNRTKNTEINERLADALRQAGLPE